MSLETFEFICYAWLALALTVHLVLFRIPAPFGRHTTDKWGPTVDARMAWVVMELPSLLIMCVFSVMATDASYVLVLFVLWIIHYLNRTLVFPFRMRSKGKRMPVVIMLNAVLFNVINAGLNGYFLACIAPLSKYDAHWLMYPVTLAGAFLFGVGLFINWRADHILIHLRDPGGSGYSIPNGFLFKWVSAPNLLGEVIEWAGFALMAWNLPALTFAIWTYANLVPRAMDHHNWYKARFPDYPTDRKAIFPHVL